MYVGLGTMQCLASPQDLFPQTPNLPTWKQTLIISVIIVSISYIISISSTNSIMIMRSSSMIQRSADQMWEKRSFTRADRSLSSSSTHWFTILFIILTLYHKQYHSHSFHS